MRVSRWLPTTLLLALALVRSASGAGFEEKRFYLAPFAGWTFFDNERLYTNGQPLLNDAYFGGRGGVRLNNLLWIDLAGGYASTKACADKVTWSHYSANLMFSPASARRVNPFLTVGGGRESFGHQGAARVTSGTLEGAAGLRVRLSDVVGLRLEARDVYALSKNDLTGHHFNDVVLGAGLNIAFGGSSADTDGDGVRDGKDKCPETPHGCRVDENGCPLDADGDGVCDGIDQCPDTAMGCTVDARGCPSDTDGDGVCDGKDQCVGTPAGTAVDVRGCPVVVEQPKPPEPPKPSNETTWLETIHFKFNDARLRDADLPAMRRTLDWMRANTDAVLAIHGHADWVGTDEYNQKLSENRAKTAYTWLVANGVAASRLTMHGEGESQPVADNATDEGRTKNRRAEFGAMGPMSGSPKN